MAEERNSPQQKVIKETFVGNSVSQAESPNICYIREGFLISRPSPKASARVIQSFSIQLFPTEEGYVATSDLCNIYELAMMSDDAMGSYLHSLIDELIWLQEHEEALSKPLREELNRLRIYIGIV